MSYTREQRSCEPGLVSRTHLDESKNLSSLMDDTRPTNAHNVLKIRVYDSGYAEITATKVIDPIVRSTSAKLVDDVDDDNIKQRKENNISRSIRRSRKTVCRKALIMSADRMLTLTYKENKTDRELCCKDFVRFVRKMRDKFSSFDYVCTLERQKRGAWHFHIATNKFYHIQTVNKLWQSVVGEGKGNVDIEFKHRISPTRIAKYISKYISKGFSGDDSALPGRNRYRVSLGLVDPVVTGYMALAPSQELYLFSTIFEEVTGSIPTNAFSNMYCFCLDNFD